MDNNTYFVVCRIVTSYGSSYVDRGNTIILAVCKTQIMADHFSTLYRNEYRNIEENNWPMPTNLDKDVFVKKIKTIDGYNSSSKDGGSEFITPWDGANNNHIYVLLDAIDGMGQSDSSVMNIAYSYETLYKKIEKEEGDDLVYFIYTTLELDRLYDFSDKPQCFELF